MGHPGFSDSSGEGILALQSLLFAGLAGAHILVLRLIQELWLSTGGVFLAVGNFVLFPWLARRVLITTLFRASSAGLALIYCSLPFLPAIAGVDTNATAGSEEGEEGAECDAEGEAQAEALRDGAALMRVTAKRGAAFYARAAAAIISSNGCPLIPPTGTINVIYWRLGGESA